MKQTFLTLSAVMAATCCFAGGQANFANSSLTLITVDGLPMPVQSVEQFNFAVFLAPASTVSVQGVTPSFTDPAFQLAGGYTINHPTAPGRLTTINLMDIGAAGGFGPNALVDFVVRGWSANLGATWATALANWNNGNPLVPNSGIGSSTIGNDLLLGGASNPFPTLFGALPDQIPGFNIVTVPEPATASLAAIGTAAWLALRKRR